MGRRLEPAHCSLPLSRRLMGVLGAIIQAFTFPMLGMRQHVLQGWSIACRLVGHQTRLGRLPLHQTPEKGLGGLLISPLLDQNVEHHPILVDRTQEPTCLGVDVQSDVVGVPFVAWTRSSTLDLRGKGRSELSAPLADRLVTYLYTSIGKGYFDVATAERESDLQPRRMGNNLCGNTMPPVHSRRAHHALLFLVSAHPSALLA
jgi:hypothetical protein